MVSSFVQSTIQRSLASNSTGTMSTAEGLTRNVNYLRQQKWGIKQRELELVSAKNQILPQVDVTGFARWVGVGDEFAARQSNRDSAFPNPGSNALEELTHGGDYQEVGARLEITPPAFGARRPIGKHSEAVALQALKERRRASKRRSWP